MPRVLLFGGSFNPIHHGHLIVGRHVAEHLAVNRVVLMPSAVPPHKSGDALAPAADRLAMCRLVEADDPLFEVSDWETRQPPPNYSLHTVQHFRNCLGADADLYWLVGMDSLAELHTWHRAPELVDACTIVTAARPGAVPPATADLGRYFSAAQTAKLLRKVIEGPRIDIASTDIRRRVHAGLSIRYLVPDSIERYIREHGLFKSPPSSSSRPAPHPTDPRGT